MEVVSLVPRLSALNEPKARLGQGKHRREQCLSRNLRKLERLGGGGGGGGGGECVKAGRG